MTWNSTAPPTWFRRAQWRASWSKRNGVHYLDDDIVIDLGWASLTGLSTYRKVMTGFEWGVDGEALLFTDRELTTPFGAVSGTPRYDSAHAYGNLSMRVPHSTTQQCIVLNVDSARIDQYNRLYLYATQFPVAGPQWLARTQQAALWLDTDGKLKFGVFGMDYALTTPIALNQWVRIEWRMKWAYPAQADSIYEVKLFNNPDSEAPTEVVTEPNSLFASTNATYMIGNAAPEPTPDWGADIWIDNVIVAHSEYPGPWSLLEDQPPPNPIRYSIYDYYGNEVTTGTFEEGHTWFRPLTPNGGWKPGWYRVYLTGPQTDATYGSSYGATNFCVVRDDAHFVAMPAGDTVGGYTGEAPDFVMKGVMGLGTSRLIITDLDDPTVEIATAQQELALTQAYWSDNGIPDTARANREPWCTFPYCDGSPEQLANVTAVVSALYPDCKYYEGPSNEPARNAGTATAMQAFAAAVHAGNAGAKAIGPCFVETWGWESFLDAGGGAHCDEISFHAYNAATNGDLNLGRYSLETLTDLLASHGLSSKPLWQTESVGPGIIPYGIYHPRRARKALMETLLFEQYGVPRERNNWWYDISHGFWDVPAWIENGDGSLEPAVVLGRVLAEETWGKPYSAALDFGTIGNAMYLGSVYSGASGKTVVLMATSYMTGASVTLEITGDAGPFTVVDGFGRERDIPLSKQKLTVSLTDVPSYVRLPVGATVTVYRVNGHSPLGLTASVSPSATTKQIDGATWNVIADDGYLTSYGPQTGAAPGVGRSAVPGNTTLIWVGDRTIERVVIWCEAWQPHGTLIDFDVQTYDGVGWTTRKTVTKPDPPWFSFRTDDTTQACFEETFWDEQWIFDVELDTPVSCSGVRLNVRQASYGGEPLPDNEIADGQGGGQGDSVQGYRLQEIAVVDANRYVGVAV